MFQIDMDTDMIIHVVIDIIVISIINVIDFVFIILRPVNTLHVENCYGRSQQL